MRGARRVLWDQRSEYGSKYDSVIGDGHILECRSNYERSVRVSCRKIVQGICVNRWRNARGRWAGDGVH